jgi:hypothetical protein
VKSIAGGNATVETDDGTVVQKAIDDWELDDDDRE